MNNLFYQTNWIQFIYQQIYNFVVFTCQDLRQHHPWFVLFVVILNRMPSNIILFSSSSSLLLWKQYEELNKSYVGVFKQLSSITSSIEKEDPLFSSLTTISSQMIEVLYKISNDSNTPIIPEIIYNSLHYLQRFEHYICGGILGAGGYDSFYVFILGNENRHQLQQYLNQFDEKMILLDVQIDDRGLLVEYDVWEEGKFDILTSCFVFCWLDVVIELNKAYIIHIHKNICDLWYERE